MRSIPFDVINHIPNLVKFMSSSVERLGAEVMQGAVQSEESYPFGKNSCPPMLKWWSWRCSKGAVQ